MSTTFTIDTARAAGRAIARAGKCMHDGRPDQAYEHFAAIAELYADDANVAEIVAKIQTMKDARFGGALDYIIRMAFTEGLILGSVMSGGIDLPMVRERT